jgi:hypothetical protein
VAPRYREPGSLYSYVSLGLGIVRDTMQSEPGYFVEVVFEVSIYNHSNGMYYGYRGMSSSFFSITYSSTLLQLGITTLYFNTLKL